MLLSAFASQAHVDFWIGSFEEEGSDLGWLGIGAKEGEGHPSRGLEHVRSHAQTIGPGRSTHDERSHFSLYGLWGVCHSLMFAQGNVLRRPSTSRLAAP